MDDAEKLSLEAIGRFVAASEEIRFEAEDRQQFYDWVERVLVEQQCYRQSEYCRTVHPDALNIRLNVNRSSHTLPKHPVAR
jgi:hypothetical protein